MSKPYYWWTGTDLAGFFAEVNARGLQNVRVEFHPGDELLRVVPTGELKTTAAAGTYNFVKVCPPYCPD